MSTNLGWPSEPEPGPEHRRLGWLARMLGVSRETADVPAAAQSAAEPVGAQSEEATATSPADPAALVDTSAAGTGLGEQAPVAETTQAPEATPDRTDADEAESQPAPAARDLSGREGTDADDSVVSPVLGTAEVGGPADTEVAADNASETAGSLDVTETGGNSEDAGSDGPGVSEAVSAVAEAVATDPDAPLEPVDKAVDEATAKPHFERGTDAFEAGDNVVDDASPMTQLEHDHADREALAAALPTPGTDTPLARELADNARRRIQLTGRQFPKPASQRVLTVANQKGGVGKTTTTVNVAAALAQSGLKVLVIDLDPQGNASTALGIDHHAEVPSIYDVLVDGTPLLDVIQPCTTVDHLFCAPATIDLAGAEIELVSLVARESRLQKAIAAATESGHEFDYILIDCPPSLGLLTVNAMVAASEVFIPIQCEYYALEGLSQLLKNIDLIKRHLNPALHVSTILLTMYDGRTRLSAQVADEVREHFPQEVLRTTVPRSVRVSEAPSFGETVMTYDPASSGALAYLEAAGEMADRGAEGRT
ncbi:ParA family protein [Terrabacter carboxydivorans]